MTRDNHNGIWVSGKEKGRSEAPFLVFVGLASGISPALLSGCRQSALVSGRGVLVDQAFARGAVQQLHRGQSLLGGSGGRPLEGGAERGFLGAVADRSGT